MERVTFLVEDSGERIECLLNPETVVLRRKAGIVRYPALSLESEGAVEDLVVRVGGGATEIELELLFDIQIAPQPVTVEDVRSLTSKLWELTEFDGEQPRAPVVHMFWGKVFSMRVVFAAVAERLDAINASGAARRSWLSARLVRVPDPPRRTTEDVLANPRPSETLPEVAGEPTQSGEGIVAGERADAVPDAEELERRAAEESGLWDWVRELVADAGDGASEGGAVAGEADGPEPDTVADDDAASGDSEPSPDEGATAVNNDAAPAAAVPTASAEATETSRGQPPRGEHGPTYRLLVATPQQAAHRLFDAIRSLVASHQTTPEEAGTSGDDAEASHEPAARAPAAATSSARPAQSSARPAQSSARPAPDAPRAPPASTPSSSDSASRPTDDAVTERLRSACNEPSRVTEQFERYAQALERQATTAIRRAQEEHARALEQVTRQGIAPLQRLAERGEALQQQSAEQQRALQRQNEAHLNALTQNFGHFMDASSKAFQDGIAAQNKATDQLLTQIGETWKSGERERARQLEQLLDKQRALASACDASSVATRREPRTQQLDDVLVALREASPAAEPPAQARLIELLSAVLVFHASLAQALAPVLDVLRDRQSTLEARQRAHATALQVLGAEARERREGRAEQWSGALKPPVPTATRLDNLAAERKGNPASWRDVVEAAPGRALV